MPPICVTEMDKTGPASSKRPAPVFTLITSTDPVREKQLEARQQNRFTDFIVKVENEQIPCHKLILSLQSAYFNRMLSHENTAEVVEGSVTLKELDQHAVLQVIEFFYSGKINIEFDLAQEVMEVVNYFHVNDDTILKKLTEYVVNNLQAENSLGWYFTADQLNVSKVKEKASDILVQKFRDVVNGPEFVKLECKQFMDFLGLVTQKKAVNSDQTLDATVKWTMHDVASRKDTFEEMIKQIDLTKCSPNVLRAVYEKHGKALITNGDIQQQFTLAALALATGEPSDVLVIGGLLDRATTRHKWNQNSQIWTLNLKTGAYMSKASYPKCQYYAAICKAPKGAICAGGATAANVEDGVTACSLFDTEKNVWSKLPPIPALTYGTGAVCVDDELLVVLGGKNSNKKMYCFDMNTKIWSALPDMLQGMQWPIIGCINRCMYVIFSTFTYNEAERKGSEISFQCFDITTQTWCFKAPLPDRVKETYEACVHVVTLAGSLYVYIGMEKISLRYDPDPDSWTVLAQSLEVHRYGAMCTVGKMIILSGGEDINEKASDSMEEYDPSNDTWRLLLPVKLPIRLSEHILIPV